VVTIPLPLLWIFLTGFQGAPPDSNRLFPPKILFEPFRRRPTSICFTTRLRGRRLNSSPVWPPAADPGMSVWCALAQYGDRRAPRKVVPRFVNSMVIGFRLEPFLAVWLWGPSRPYAFLALSRVPLADDLFVLHPVDADDAADLRLRSPIYLMFRKPRAHRHQARK